MENPIKMDDLGVPLFLETPTLFWCFGLDFQIYQHNLRGANITPRVGGHGHPLPFI